MAATSLADLLDQLLQPPRRALKLVGLIGAVLAMFVVSIVLTLWSLQRLKILPEDAKVEGFEVHFSKDTSTDKVRRYFFVVHPQGWQETPVRLNKGDHLEIQAAGSITIDMWGLNTYSTRRDNIDRAITREAQKRHEWTDANVPEDFYTKSAYSNVIEAAALLNGPIPDVTGERVGNNVVQRIRPARGWTGPRGYAESPHKDTAYPSRQKKRVSTSYPYGALLGTIAPEVSSDCTTERVLKFVPKCVPGASNTIFSVTDDKPSNPAADGEERALWLIVNDVLDTADPIFPEKFFVDNLGFFYVEVVVTPAGH